MTQTCGLPLVTEMSSSLRAVAVPSYSVPGCHGWSYSSVIIASASSSITSLEALQQHHGQLIAAVNSLGSLSGCLALQAAIAQASCFASFRALSQQAAQDKGPSRGSSKTAAAALPGNFKRVDVTGSHAESMACVAESRAHVACIDCVTYALLLQQQPEISRHIRVVARTPSAPCLPYCTSITSSEATCDALFSALEAAAADPRLQHVREALKITGFQRYSRVPLGDTHADNSVSVHHASTAPSCSVMQRQPSHGLAPKCLSTLSCVSSASLPPLCPYQVAVSRLFLRARGSNSVRTPHPAATIALLDDHQVDGSELLAQPLGVCPAAAVVADMEMAGKGCFCNACFAGALPSTRSLRTCCITIIMTTSSSKSPVYSSQNHCWGLSLPLLVPQATPPSSKASLPAAETRARSFPVDDRRLSLLLPPPPLRK